jgi:hypothetical protein
MLEMAQGGEAFDVDPNRVASDQREANKISVEKAAKEFLRITSQSIATVPP